MSFLPPWVGLLGVLLVLGVLAAWVLGRGLKKSQYEQTTGLGLPPIQGSGQSEGDLQARTLRQIQQQHLADLDQSLAEGRLLAPQHAAARDELMRHVLADAAAAPPQAAAVRGLFAAPKPVSWSVWVVALVLMSAVSYLQLGAPQSWRPLPLSQRVQISANTPAQLTEQTRLWQQATLARPDDVVAWLTLARLLAAQNAYALAEQALARVLALSPEPDLWIERAQMKALSAGGVYAGEPWQWIQDVLRAQPQHLNALVLAGSAALSEQHPTEAQAYWQQALQWVPADSEAAQGLQQAMAQAAAQSAAQSAANSATQTAVVAKAQGAATPLPAAGASLAASPTASAPAAPAVAAAPAATAAPAVTAAPAAASDRAEVSAADSRPLIQGEVRVSPEVQSQIPAGATLFVYALAEEGSRRPVAIWRGTPSAWPVRFALSDSMGMGAPPLLSSLAQVRLVARISQSGAAQKQAGDFQVELPGVKTRVQGVVLNISARTP